MEKYNSFRIGVPSEFRDVFTHFYFARNTSNEDIFRTLLPSFQTIMIFNFGTGVKLISKERTQIVSEKCIVLGPIKKAFDYIMPQKSEILVIHFKDDAFYRFFGTTLAIDYLPLNPDDLLEENCFTALWGLLKEVPDIHMRINHILEFSRPFLKKRNPIAHKLLSIKGTSIDPIKSIAGEENQTIRTIQSKHKSYLGYTAKEVIRYERFLKAIQIIQEIASKSLKPDWFDIINECGYYDQSQLIHDFKFYINLSPTKYLKFQKDICNPTT